MRNGGTRNEKDHQPAKKGAHVSDRRRARDDDERCGSERWEGGRHGRHDAVVELPGAEVREAGR